MNRRKNSVPVFHGGSTKFRQGVFQLMIHSVDPLHSVDQEILQAHAGNASTAIPESSADKAALGSQHTHPPGATDCTMCEPGAAGENDSGDASNNNPGDASKGQTPLQVAQVSSATLTVRRNKSEGSSPVAAISAVFRGKGCTAHKKED